MDNTSDVELEPTQQGVSEGTKARQAREVKQYKVKGKAKRAAPRQDQTSSGGVLANLRISRKLALIALAFMIPLVAIFAFYAASQRAILVDTVTERRALDYLAPLDDVLRSLSLHRDLSVRLLSGDASLAEPRRAAAAEVNLALAALLENQERYGEGFGASENVAELLSGWQALERRIPTTGPETAFQEHANLISGYVFPLFERVGDRSGLGRSSTLSNYYLAQLTLDTLPRVSESLSQLRDQGSGILTRGVISAQEQQQLSTLLSQLEADFEAAEREIGIATEEQPAYTARLNQALAEFDSLASYTTAIARYNLEQRFNPDLSPTTFFQEATRSVVSSFALLNTTDAILAGALDEQISDFRSRRIVNTGALLLVLALSTGLVFLIARQITRPVGELATVAERVSQGDLSRFVQVNTKDELGILAGSFNRAINGLRQASERNERERQQSEALQSNVSAFLDVAMDIAEGDFTKRGNVTEDVLGNIVDAINLMVEEVAALLSQTQDAARSVNSGASEMIATTESIAQSAARQVTEAERARAEAEQVTASIRQMAQQADASANASTKALEASRQGEAAVQNTLKGMQGIRTEVQGISERTQSLTQRSDEISGIVRSISRIASQTNLLALSASLEAAGAGEAGQRFATVATEVQTLAEDSANAARQVASIIRELQIDIRQVSELTENGSREVEAGYQVATEAGQRLREIAEISTQSAELARFISQATQAQVQGVTGVNEVVQAMAEISQASQGSVSQGRDAAERLQQLAAQLTEGLSRFRLGA